MINTVTGKIDRHELGNTRVHEHILWTWTGDVKAAHSRNDVVNNMLPYLKKLKEMGCDTLMEATPDGAGRDAEVLRELSEKSGLNIIANCGVWDGLNYKGIYVPEKLLNMRSEEIAELWLDEFNNGIGDTSVKPGFIKIGLGDNDHISEFQLRFLKAAIITSKNTDMPIVSHICSSESAERIVDIAERDNLELSNFVWSHADFSYDQKKIVELAGRGIWIELSWHIADLEDYSWYVDLFKRMEELQLMDRLLVSQDAGGYHKGDVVPYDNFYTSFMKDCLFKGVSREIFDKLLIDNPAGMLGRY